MIAESCPKCSGADLHTRYIEKRTLLDHSSLRRVENEFVTSDEYDFFYKLTAAKDHLLHHCRRCQYAWRANTADSQAQRQA